MHHLLKNDREKRSEILDRAFLIAEQYYAKQDTMSPGLLVADVSMDDLPENGNGALETLEFFDRNYSQLITNSAGPRYFGFVTGGSTPASVAGDWLVSAYDQNACGSNDTIAPQLERQALHYLKQLFGLHADFFGSFVTGATMSNFVGLALGRQWVGEQYGVDAADEGVGKFPVKVLSGSPHSSIVKSMAMTGMGRRALERIETLSHREAVDVRKLENFLIQHEGPVIVVANAGTVNTGDFDDLQALTVLKGKYDFWLHVDAAFGGFAACSEKFSHLINGINGADSITIDAHKWLNVPYDTAMQFTKHRALQLKVFQNSAAYLGDPSTSPDYFHYTPENSRRWRALPAWFSLRAYGKSGYREVVERTCALAAAFANRIEESEAFQLLSPVHLNIVCFTLSQPNTSQDDIKAFLQAVRDQGQVFFTPTSYKGIPAIRAAISNWQTTADDIQIAFEAISKVCTHTDGVVRSFRPT